MPATFAPVFARSTHASRVLHLTGAALLLAGLLFVGTPAIAQVTMVTERMARKLRQPPRRRTKATPSSPTAR